MFQRFTVTTINIDKARKILHVNFSEDVDEESVNISSVYITNIGGDVINTTVSVDGSDVSLAFTGEILLNTPYFLVVTKKVLSAMGSALDHAVKREFSFKTKCRSTVEIVSPSNFEELSDSISLKWKESRPQDDDAVYSYRVQVALEHFFENIVQESVSSNTEIVLAKPQKSGAQYYARVRAELDQEDFGIWSSPVVFTIKGEAKKAAEQEAEDMLSDIYVPSLNILTLPEQGETPATFLIEFDDELDPKTVEDAVIILERRI